MIITSADHKLAARFANVHRRDLVLTMIYLVVEEFDQNSKSQTLNFLDVSAAAREQIVIWTNGKVINWALEAL